MSSHYSIFAIIAGGEDGDTAFAGGSEGDD